MPPPFRTRREPVRGGLDETSVFHTVLNGGDIPPLLRQFETGFTYLIENRRTGFVFKLGWVFTSGTVSFREETSEPPGMGSRRVPEVNTHLSGRRDSMEQRLYHGNLSFRELDHARLRKKVGNGEFFSDPTSYPWLRHTFGWLRQCSGSNSA